MDENRSAVLVIGGTDPTSGAGIHRDNTVLNVLNTHCFSVVSAVTAQNSQGVLCSQAVDDKLFEAQLDSITSEFSPRVVKAGLFGNSRQFALLKRYINDEMLLVWDPVMVSSSGSNFLNRDAVLAGIELFAGKISLLTPNISEASSLTGISINSVDDMLKAATLLINMGISAVLIKGGHVELVDGESCDLFASACESFWIVGKRYEGGVGIRGTGCALASAVAASMACGYDMRDAVVLARAILSKSIQRHYSLGNMDFQIQSGWPENYQTFPVVRYGRKPQAMVGKFPRCVQNPGIYPVVPDSLWVEKLLTIGVRTIQLRIKDASDELIDSEIQRANHLAISNNARLYVNDHWECAIRHQVYGVHLGQEDIQGADLEAIARAGLRLGISTHSFWEVAAALNIDPSYIAIGPVFETTSKEMPFSPQGVDRVRFWMRFFENRWPLVAIGGIDQQRALMLKNVGVNSIAMISAITQAQDYVAATRELMDIWDGS